MSHHTEVIFEVGDKVIDLAGQNGVGTIIEVSEGQVKAAWTSHRWDGERTGWIGKRWVSILEKKSSNLAAQPAKEPQP